MNFDFLSPGVIQFLTFGLIGVWNTVFDLVLWSLFMRMISDGSRVDRLIGRIGLNKFSFAHGEAFIVANIGSYFLNRTFTFAGEPIEDTSRSIGAFFAVSAFSLVISVLLINFLTINQAVLSFSRTNKYLEKYWPTIAKFLSIFVTLITNFIGYKFLAF